MRYVIPIVFPHNPWYTIEGQANGSNKRDLLSSLNPSLDRSGEHNGETTWIDKVTLCAVPWSLIFEILLSQVIDDSEPTIRTSSSDYRQREAFQPTLSLAAPLLNTC